MMTDRVYARALVLAGEQEPGRREVLRVLCRAACEMLEARLREGMTPEDCGECFITAAALEAAGALEELGGAAEFRAGDLTVKTGSTEALRRQAWKLMEPYLKDRFLFTGV